MAARSRSRRVVGDGCEDARAISFSSSSGLVFVNSTRHFWQRSMQRRIRRERALQMTIKINFGMGAQIFKWFILAMRPSLSSQLSKSQRNCLTQGMDNC